MKRNPSGGVAEAVRTNPALRTAKKLPKMPEPSKEHEWLQQLVGKWHAKVEAFMEPGERPERSEGMENVHDIGGFWTVAQYKGTFMNKPFRGMLTLGYDARKGKYVGTWIGSMDGNLWEYEGTLDETGKTLTLETEGACPTTPDTLTRFKEVIEMMGPDNRRFTSYLLADDGKWITAMIINYTRT